VVEKTEIVDSIGDSFPATRNHRSIDDFALRVCSLDSITGNGKFALSAPLARSMSNMAI
jgi:hypothetical protein